MSVLTHLTSLANTLKIQDAERIGIDRSINNLNSKVNLYISNVENKFVYGSYDRKTILKRSYDPNSDVDYMIVFSDGASYQPQTLINRVKNFVQTIYTRSEIYQSSPTVVLELNHIKFEITPAYQSWGTLYIPAPSSNYNDWISTYPQQIKTDLNTKNQSNLYLIRKLVRLLKYWNVKNNKVYSSYELENLILSFNYLFCLNLKDYLFTAVENLPIYHLSLLNQIKVNRLKNIIAETKKYEAENMPYSAELEIAKEF